MNNYYQKVPITEKPERDGEYGIVDPTGFFGQGKFENGSFYIWVWSPNRFVLLVGDSFSWLRPLTTLPIDRDTAEKIWEAAEKRSQYDNCRFKKRYFAEPPPDKETYLKQFS